MKKILLISSVLFINWGAIAQLTLLPIPKHYQNKSANARIAVLGITDTLSLPFWDDFFYDGQDPDTLWLHGNDVLINATGAYNPPSLNVATFDGSRADGTPHSSSEVVSPTDSLVSRPIDLSQIADSKKQTVYLSFYWQKRGRNESPDATDSLRVQLLTSDNTWITAMSLMGADDSDSSQFKQEYIQINEAKYFHEGFKFKFQNFGKGSGPFDVWHIDYVYLNQDRTAVGETIFDHTIATEPVSLFNYYANIPYDQLFDMPDSMFIPYKVGLASQERAKQPYKFTFEIRDSATNQVIYTETKSGGGINPAELPALNNTYNVSSVILTDVIPKSIFNQNRDSLILKTEFQLTSGDKLLIKSINNGGLDTTFVQSDVFNYRANDTLRRTYLIHETLSYDDGTAEFAAAINKNNGKIAVEYWIPTADTLTAIDIYFPKIEPRSGGKLITLSVLKNLNIDDSNAIVMAQDESVVEGENINEFIRYMLRNPIIVSDTFFVSFEQYTDDFIAVGLDKNNPQPNSIYTNVADVWLQNNANGVNGSLMIRPIFGNSSEVITAIDDVIEAQISIYPNPSKDEINIIGIFQNVNMYSISGEKMDVVLNGNVLNVSEIDAGVYILKIESNSKLITKKVILKKY